MDITEKVLYHQIHPAKLAADVAGSFVSTCLLWQHKFGLAMLTAFAPAILGSVFVLRFADLERLKQSTLGRYVCQFMNRRVEAWRFAGQVVVWLGAWYHQFWLIPAGVAMTMAAWMSGRWRNRKELRRDVTSE
jgi:hypothetical protein